MEGEGGRGRVEGSEREIEGEMNRREGGGKGVGEE